MKSKLYVLLSLLAFGVSLTSSTHALAAPATYIVVDPPLQSVTLEKTDQQKEITVSVTNQASTHQTFKLSTINFGSLNETGGIVFEGSNNSSLIKKYGLADWLKLDSPLLELDAGQTVPVKVTIVNDNKLTPGGHYGALVVSTTNEEAKGSGKVTINQKVSSLIFATKLGGETYDMSLTKISSNKTVFKAPTTVTLEFKNTGNTQVVPRGVVSLVYKNKTLARGIINEPSSLLLPETSRLFDVNLHTLESHSTTFVDKMTLKVDYRYDGYDAFASKTQEVMIFNPWFIILCTFIFTSVVIGFFRYRKPSPKKKNKTKK